LCGGEVSANAERGEYRWLLVMAFVVDGDREADRIEQIDCMRSRMRCISATSCGCWRG
jgi:hypothetical protein